MQLTERFSFDGCGINHVGGFCERIANIKDTVPMLIDDPATNRQIANPDYARIGHLLAAAPDMKRCLEAARGTLNAIIGSGRLAGDRLTMVKLQESAICRVLGYAEGACELEPIKAWWTSSDGTLELAIPEAAIEACTHSGQCSADVAAWYEQADWDHVTPAKLVLALAETGGWSRQELLKESLATLRQRLFWVACNDLAEGNG